MFSRIGTIAIVAVMALLLSGVAIAQIGVFETPEIDLPGSSATIDQAPNVMPASESTSNDIPSTTAPDYADEIDDSEGFDFDSDKDDDSDDSDYDKDEYDSDDHDSDDSDEDDYDDDSDDSDYDSDDYESDDYDTDDGSDDSDNDAYDSDDYDSDDKDESYLSVPGTVMAGSVEYAAADAGTVWITFDGYYLTFDNYVLNDGWYVTKQDVKSDQIQLEFHSCQTKVEFKAEVDNGQVKLDVKSSPDYYEGYCKDEPMMPAESVEYAAADAGTVWITFDGYYLTFDNYVLNDGWYVTKQDVKSDQIQLEFHNTYTKVEFKAEVDNGQVKLEVKSSPDN